MGLPCQPLPGRAQYDAHEGPSLDAVDTPIVYPQSFPDARWPTLSSRPAEPDASSDEAQRIGWSWPPTPRWPPQPSINAAPCRVWAQNLNKALLSRDVIGQAKGILMERLKITPEDAFEALRRSSNRLNEKLAAVVVCPAPKAMVMGRCGSADAERPPVLAWQG